MRGRLGGDFILPYIYGEQTCCHILWANIFITKFVIIKSMKMGYIINIVNIVFSIIDKTPLVLSFCLKTKEATNPT